MERCFWPGPFWHQEEVNHLQKAPGADKAHEAARTEILIRLDLHRAGQFRGQAAAVHEGQAEAPEGLNRKAGRVLTLAVPGFIRRVCLDRTQAHPA